jgi:hypothetical protein
MNPVWSSWIAIVVGAVAAGSALAGVRRTSRTRSWPAVAGEILEAEVAPVSGGRGGSYRVAFRYRYAVDGRKYEGTREDAAGGEIHDTQDAAMAHAMRCAPGTPVEVYYDPHEPHVAVLERAAAEGVVLRGAIGVAALVYGTVTLLLR